MTLAEMIPTLRGSLPHPLEPWLWPATTSHVAGGDLSVGGVRMAELAREFGTPCYVLDVEEFRSRCRSYRAAFHDGAVAYAGKALLTRAVVHIVEEEGLLLDVCSAGELALAWSAGFPGGRLILHGNAKTPQLLADALAAGVGRIVIDSLEEIELVAAAAAGRDEPVDVLLRLTPGVDPHTHWAITTGTEDQKFGLSISDGSAAHAVGRVRQHRQLRLIGIHCHLGSQITSTSPYEQAAWRLIAFMAAVRAHHNLTLSELNLGGGHAIAYHPGDVPLAAGDVAVALRRAVSVACRDHGLTVPTLVVEPGRAIAGPAGLTIYRVLGVKHSASRTWVSVTGGMADNPRPALYGARYTARLLGRLSPAVEEHMSVVGQHCEAGDVLIEDALLPADIRTDDLLVVPSTGAYHHSMASNYNLIPRPPLIGVGAGLTRTLVRRETLEDLQARDLG